MFEEIGDVLGPVDEEAIPHYPESSEMVHSIEENPFGEQDASQSVYEQQDSDIEGEVARANLKEGSRIWYDWSLDDTEHPAEIVSVNRARRHPGSEAALESIEPSNEQLVKLGL